MKKTGKRCVNCRAGTSLVELVVTLMISGILMMMMVGILHPAANIFLKMQRLWHAQAILDNIAVELRGIGQDAFRYVKIYEKGDAVAETEGTDSGAAIEFVNPKKYAALISADGCEETELLLDDVLLDTLEPVGDGRLMTRYYAREESNDTYSYRNAGGDAVARAGSSTFTDGYYMGTYLKLVFSYPPSVADGDEVPYLKVRLELYADEAQSELLAKETMVIDFFNTVKRKDAVTASTALTP